MMTTGSLFPSDTDHRHRHSYRHRDTGTGTHRQIDTDTYAHVAYRKTPTHRWIGIIILIIANAQ